MRRVLVLGAAAAIWAAAAVAIVAITASTNAHWNAEVGYLLLLVILASAWTLTHALLRFGRMRCPYRLRRGRVSRGGEPYA